MGVADHDHLLGNGFAGTDGLLVGQENRNITLVSAPGLCGGGVFGFQAVEGYCPVDSKVKGKKSLGFALTILHAFWQLRKSFRDSASPQLADK